MFNRLRAAHSLYWLLSAISATEQVTEVQAMELARRAGVDTARLRLGHLFSVNASAPLVNRLDCSYLAQIGIGNQSFSVILDTGSSDLWITSRNCTDNDCAGVHHYESAPIMYDREKYFELDYLYGQVAGVIAYETVSIGRYRVHNQTIALANHTSGLNLASAGYSGIMGLAFPAEASIAPLSGQTLLSNIMSPLPDPQKFFAVSLGREDTPSSFTVGELDTTFNLTMTNFTFSNVLPRTGGTYDYWKLPLVSLTVDGVPLTFSPSKVSGSRRPVAVLDTGTTLILGPSADVDRLWAAVGVTKKNAQGQWYVKCNRSLIVRMRLGYKEDDPEFVLDPVDANWAHGGREGAWCLGGIQANDAVNSGDWLLGDVFLRNVYVTHHPTEPPKIGIFGTTVLATALATFRRDRGPDNSSPVLHIQALTSTTEGKSSPLLYLTSLMIGLLIGGAVMRCGMWYISTGRRRPAGRRIL